MTLRVGEAIVSVHTPHSKEAAVVVLTDHGRLLICRWPRETPEEWVEMIVPNTTVVVP